MQKHPQSGEPPTKVVFGCVLATDDDLSRRQLSELCRALSRTLRIPVEPSAFASPKQLAASFGQGEIDLAWASPTLALLSPELKDGVPVVRSIREGAAHYHGVLFVRRDAPAASVTDLKDTRAAWVDETSAAGYIFPRVALAAYGILPQGLFKSERFHGSHGAVARAVFEGEADVGATFATFERGDPTKRVVRAGFLEVADVEQARIVLATPPIPSDLIVATGALSESLGERLIDCVEDLVHEPDALDALRYVLGADGLVRSDPHALKQLRQQIDDAEELGLVPPG